MIIVNDIEQGSPEWFEAKLGKPSASNASKIITNDGKPSKQRTGYLYELAAERITGRREEGYKNANMEMGNEREQESRDLFEILNDVKVEQVGLIYKTSKQEILCSPDGLIGTEAGLELKNVLPKTQVKYLLAGGLPSEYFGQIQFSLYVTGFKKWQLFSYVPAMEPLHIVVERNDKYIEALDRELKRFNEELEETVRKIK